MEGCVEILLATGRTAEAVLFAQTYAPSKCGAIVGEWKKGLEKGAVRGDELDEDEGGRAEDWRRRGTRSRGGGDDG